MDHVKTGQMSRAERRVRGIGALLIGTLGVSPVLLAALAFGLMEGSGGALPVAPFKPLSCSGLRCL